MRPRSLIAGLIPLAALATAAIITPVLAADPVYSGPAVVTLTSTLVDGTGQTVGTVQLHQDASGVVLVRIDATGLPAGAHGVHIHSVGTCEGPAFTSAGGHFNPGGKKHGLDSADGPHAGDLTGIGASFTGVGTVQVTTNRISLKPGPNAIADADGAALVIHAAADDQVTDPSGNTGARIACAVLAAPNPALATPAPTPTKVAPAPPSTGTGAATSEQSRWPVFAGITLIGTALGLGALRLTSRRR